MQNFIKAWARAAICHGFFPADHIERASRAGERQACLLLWLEQRMDTGQIRESKLLVSSHI